MRTWYGYDAQGRLRSIESHTGGWPEGADFNNPASHPSLAGIVAERRTRGINAFYMYDCPCLPTANVCSCHNTFMSTYYIEGGEAKLKPVTTLKINGVAYQRRAQVPVGATFTVQVVGLVPNGAEAQVVFTIPPSEPVETSLPFTDGATEELVVSVPLPGMGTVGCWGKFVRSAGVTVFRPAS